MKFPLGARGEHPVYFPAQLTWEHLRELTSIPGVVKAPGGLSTTWDIAQTIADLLKVNCPRPPTEEFLTDQELVDEVTSMPGYARYRQLGLGQRLRDYQKDGAVFLARRVSLCRVWLPRYWSTRSAL